MLLNMINSFSQSGTLSNILATFGVLIVALCSAFGWYQWKVVKKYRGFPSQRLEAQILLLFTTKTYLTDSSIPKAIFQIILNTVKAFCEKGVCVLWFPKPYVCVYSADLMKDLVNTADLADKSFAFDINKQVFGNGLLGSKHEVWKVHRKMLNPAFNLGVLKSRMPILNKNARQLVQKLETVVDKPVDDAWEYLKYCAFLNMADFVLGLKPDGEKYEVIIEKSIKIIDKVEEHFIARMFHPWLHSNFLLPFFPMGRKYLKSVSEGNSLVREITNELIADRQKVDSEVVKSCANIILKLHFQDHCFTEQDVRDHLVSLISAGYETVAITMLWCFYTLGRHPEVQEKAYCEIESLVPDGDITYDDLAKLKYMDCVIKETLRIYPSVPVIPRRATKDVQCGKYTIPKGAEVFLLVFMLHRDPTVFQEPEKFDPERFMDSSTIRPWMYIPFAEGYRNCIGKKFAMMEITTQLVHVLRRFRITSQDKINDSDLDWAIILKPGKRIRFLFEKRHPKDLC